MFERLSGHKRELGIKAVFTKYKEALEGKKIRDKIENIFSSPEDNGLAEEHSSFLSNVDWGFKTRLYKNIKEIAKIRLENSKIDDVAKFILEHLLDYDVMPNNEDEINDIIDHPENHGFDEDTIAVINEINTDADQSRGLKSAVVDAFNHEDSYGRSAKDKIIELPYMLLHFGLPIMEQMAMQAIDKVLVTVGLKEEDIDLEQAIAKDPTADVLALVDTTDVEEAIAKDPTADVLALVATTDIEEALEMTGEIITLTEQV
ncbi:MAG: hypothetical protein DGJ47_000422 [Rickettsiaceae bacterium]